MNLDMQISDPHDRGQRGSAPEAVSLREALDKLLAVDRREFQEFATDWERSPQEAIKSLGLSQERIASYRGYLADALTAVRHKEGKLPEAIDRFQNLSSDEFEEFVSRWGTNPEDAIQMLGLEATDMPGLAEDIHNVRETLGMRCFIWFWP